MTRRSTTAGLVHVTVVLKPEQLKRLRVEALRRAPPDAGRTDASAVLRDLLDDVLDGWLAKQARKS